MVPEDLHSLISSLAIKHAELADLQKEQIKETNRQIQETHRLLQENGQQLNQQIQETDRQLQETDRQLQETDRQLRQQARELGRQIGGLGDKFGSFTEGLALPSMTKILTKQFRMDFIAPRVTVRKNGREMEIDVLAYSNSGVNQAYVVEVKSHVREDSLEQMRAMLREFREFFPEHAGKQVYGILAAVHVPGDLREKVLREGIYLARIHDGQFELQVPQDFEPRAY